MIRVASSELASVVKNGPLNLAEGVGSPLIRNTAGPRRVRALYFPRFFLPFLRTFGGTTMLTDVSFRLMLLFEAAGLLCRAYHPHRRSLAAQSALSSERNVCRG